MEISDNDPDIEMEVELESVSDTEFEPEDATIAAAADVVSTSSWYSDDQEHLFVGKPVWGRYLASKIGKWNLKWYPATVRAIHANGWCFLDYDDGDTEDAVRPEFIRHRICSKSIFVGAQVLGRFCASKVNRHRTFWFNAKIRAIHADGTCDLDYDDGDTEDAVLPEFIKPRRPQAAAS